MKTARRYIYKEILKTLLLISTGFLALFFFFDLVGELASSTRRNNPSYGTLQAVWYCLLLLPQHVYELLPIAVLIACIFVMASLAQSSEFTILRTGGLGPGRALRSLLGLGVAFTVLTFVTGDYLAPYASQQAQLFRARFSGNISTGRTGAWIKENLSGNDRILNILHLTPTGTMQQIRIFDFDRAGRLHMQTRAQQGEFKDGAWELHDVQRDVVLFEPASQKQQVSTTQAASNSPDSTTNSNTISPHRLLRQSMSSHTLRTSISQSMVAAALLRPERMSATELFTYVRHLKSNGQSASNYEIPFWHKVFYPLSCLVMVVLALPFAYLHFRSGQIASAVFGGVVIGVSFFLLNNVFGYIGNLRAWTPWLAAAIPSLFYSMLSLAAFIWLVLKR